VGEEQQPIIIRRKKHGGHGHHGGAWKVAFADFMTAMMAFFLVLWLVGQKDDVKEAVAGYFRDPGAFNTQGKSGILQGSSSPVPKKSDDASVVAKPKETAGGPSVVEKKELTDAAKKILREFQKEEIFQKLKENVKMELTSEGLRITLNESEDDPAFFEPGSDKLLRKSAVLLIIIAKELGKLTNKLVLEGHTDASSGGGEFSNWELSAARANSARRLMEVSGLHQKQVAQVRGYSDQAPMIENKPSDPRNRRVSILVLYKNRNNNYDNMSVGEDLMSDIG
jgi:chemotaxis protein MotB